MNFNIKLLADWKFLLPMGVGLVSLLWSIFNFVTGKLIASKITNNDLKHLNEDVKELKDENKIIKVDLKADLNKIFKRLGKIDKGLAVRDALCNERHPRDKK